MKLDVKDESGITVISPAGSLVLGPSEDEMNATLARLIEECGLTTIAIDPQKMWDESIWHWAYFGRTLTPRTNLVTG